MSTSEVLRARAFRLALAFAATITIATAAIFALIYLQVSDANVRRIAGVLEDEAAKGRADSDERLRRELDLRITRDLRHIDYVAVFGAGGAFSFGNLAGMPAIPVDGTAHRVDRVRLADASEANDSFLFVAARRPDGGVLLLGRSLDEINAMRESVLRALGLALAPTILLVLAIGAVFARRATRRLAHIHDAITEVMAGDLNRRLPATIEGDDIDRVARDVNLMLDEICRLLDQLKSVGDNIAHDLRTPLAVARAKLERGLAHGGSIDELRATMSDALDHLDKSVATIAALLRISQFENGPRGPRFANIDLAAICAGVFEFYEPLAQSKSIALTIEAGGPAPARGDEDLFREAISNLVDNALKYTPAGGRVRIAATTRDGRAVVSVSDSGCGVPPEERDKIFRRFYRIERGGGQSGHGLGLSIAETIARVHGFTLSVDDNAPGARFEMAGPAAPPAAGAKRTERLARAG
jgi:signal transduction histidine kinase